MDDLSTTLTGTPAPGNVRPERIGALCPIWGAMVTRTINDIRFKTASTGPLVFVAVMTVYTVAGQTRRTERQDIVYRKDPKLGQPLSEPLAEDWPDATQRLVTPDAILPFCSCALTLNAHRIHYDLP